MTEKIIRTKTHASGGVTEEEKVKLKEHTEMWIKRIMRTTPTDYETIKNAICGLYRVSGLKEPEVILVESPFTMACVFATKIALIENKGKKGKVTKKLIDKIEQRIDDPVVKNIVYKAMDEAGPDVLKYIQDYSNVLQGGAYWASFDCFLTACRDVIGLDLPEYENFKYWEEAAIHGTFRAMHEDFCIVCDFPEFIKIDDQNRPHCQDGPYIRWRDGWEVFYWHGVQVPRDWIMTPGFLTAKMALGQTNIELRRVACEILGWDHILRELKAKVIDRDGDPEIGELLEVTIPDIGKEKFLRVRCGTGRTFALPVPPTMKTALEAQSWTWGIDTKNFVKPEIRT